MFEYQHLNVDEEFHFVLLNNNECLNKDTHSQDDAGRRDAAAPSLPKKRSTARDF